MEERRIVIQTFGNFDIFVDGQLVKFTRRKAKELLAYLVDRRGTSVSTREACGVLWEDEDYDAKAKNRFQHAKGDLKKVLREHGIEDLLVCQWNGLAIDCSKVQCDYYDYLKAEESGIMFIGEYMANYSWAEETAGSLWR